MKTSSLTGLDYDDLLMLRDGIEILQPDDEALDRQGRLMAQIVYEIEHRKVQVAETHFCVGWNIPGYLPDADETYVYATFEEARAGIPDEDDPRRFLASEAETMIRYIDSLGDPLRIAAYALNGEAGLDAYEAQHKRNVEALT